MKETSKSVFRRLFDSRFAHTYFVGDGIDIGAGSDSLSQHTEKFPLITSVRSWDVHDGDAVHMNGLADNSFNFVHSSHCLEHLSDPLKAFQNWIRICRPGGYLIITVPDEDLYEQGRSPSIFSNEHLTTWTTYKKQSWSRTSVNVFEFLAYYVPSIEILKVELIDHNYSRRAGVTDQTLHSLSESAIEFIVRKQTDIDIEKRGRYP